MDTLYTEMFDEQPPKLDAWKSIAAPKEVPGVQVEDFNYYLGTTSGAGQQIADQIEFQSLIDAVAEGVVLGKTAPKPEPASPSLENVATLLSDNFFTKNWLETIAKEARRTTLPSPAQMKKYDKGVTRIMERFAAKLGVGPEDERVQDVIDCWTQHVAEAVQNA